MGQSGTRNAASTPSAARSAAATGAVSFTGRPGAVIEPMNESARPFSEPISPLAATSATRACRSGFAGRVNGTGSSARYRYVAMKRRFLSDRSERLATFDSMTKYDRAHAHLRRPRAPRPARLVPRWPVRPRRDAGACLSRDVRRRPDMGGAEDVGARAVVRDEARNVLSSRLGG